MAAEDIDSVLLGWLKKLSKELDRRKPKISKLNKYRTGNHPPPDHIRQVRMEAEYRTLLKQGVTNWPELIVKSVTQRLEVIGIRHGDKTLDAEAWDLWQLNKMDARQKLIHDAALGNGRAYAIVWPDKYNVPRVTCEPASMVVCAYNVQTGERVAALRRWVENKRWHATLYLPEGLHKFRAKSEGDGTLSEDGSKWEKREVDGEEWPLPNRWGVVPVVEFAVNRSLVPNEFGNGAAEFEYVIPVIDRINTTIFAGLLAQAYSSFPVRALIGDPIKWEEVKDAQGNTIIDEATGKPKVEAVEPFKIAVNRLIQIENPDGKLVQLPEARLENYIKFAETHIRHLAAITQTPAHYLLGEMVNLSADAIRAAEAGLISKIFNHHVDLGESWEEVDHLTLRMNGDEARELPEDTETRWKNAESRSLAERADAASKLAQIMPWQWIASNVLGLTDQEITRAEAQRAGDQLLIPDESEPAVAP